MSCSNPAAGSDFLLNLICADLDLQTAIPCSAMVSPAIGKYMQTPSLSFCAALSEMGRRANLVLPGLALSWATRVLFGGVV